MKALNFFTIFLLIVILTSTKIYAQPDQMLVSEQNSNIIYSNETPRRILSKENISKTFHSSVISENLESSSIANGLSITIVESQSINSGHTQDTVWLNVVQSMGHIGTIVPQTTLDDTSFFPTTDILIISSGVIDIPVNRKDIILQYIKQGGLVYIQGEYLSSFSTNQIFQAIVDSLGGSFSWGGTVEGNLVPINVLGVLSTTPNNIPTLSYFWYGCKGSGDSTIDNYLEYGGNYFGFIFTPPNSNYGTVITNSDQDWAIEGAENHQFMENIITYFSMNIVGIKENHIDVPRGYALNQNYPNPFNPTTTISFSIPKQTLVELTITDILRKKVRTLVDNNLKPGGYTYEFDGSRLASGVYLYVLRTKEFTAVKKMLLVK